MSDEALGGWAAFEALQDVLLAENPGDVSFGEPLFRRLCHALRDEAKTSSLDLAVLIRQALRFQALRSGKSRPQDLRVRAGPRWPDAATWKSVGVVPTELGDGFVLEAEPWQPSWLPDAGSGVDSASAGAEPRRFLQQVAGDPFLARFNRDAYLSVGQRAAMRAALTTPPGATLLVCLATGEGKSFIFQMVGDLGFGDGQAGPGVTLVVTPTVALAIDQERAARDLGMLDIPRAYIGGNVATNGQIADSIAAGTQGLCLASPEAVCGALRVPLLRAAGDGHLRALVIDEAHLVDAWGSYFRPDFQVLSGVRRDLLRAAGSRTRFRTFLLSATLTDQTVATLRRFFSNGDARDQATFAVCASVRLRPEIDYWIAGPCREQERRQRVLEALCHLPRPAILYVTTVRDAKRWHRELRRHGFHRLSCMTGQTPSAERQEVVDAWKAGGIDLVVATSAFGLGIDNDEVRAVIHACVPETLDRFYQEVGRGGRDGRASVSLVIPTNHDLQIARDLNNRRLISVERGLQRWRSMFRHSSKVQHSGNRFTVRLDVPPGVDRRDIDMVGDLSTRWNQRTLALMASAGLIDLCGVSTMEGQSRSDGSLGPRAAPTWHPCQTVRVVNTGHLQREVWDALVEPERQRLKRALSGNLRQMTRYLATEECAAEVVAPLYEVSDPGGHRPLRVAKACGGCPVCRREGRAAWYLPQLDPAPPWPAAPTPAALTNLLGADGRLVVFCPPAVLGTGEGHMRTRRRLRQTLARVLAQGVRNLVALPGAGIDLHQLQVDAGSQPVFVSDSVATGRLPRGPMIMVVPPGSIMPSTLLRRPRSVEDACLFFLPEDWPDPERLGVLYRQTNPGRQWDLDEFLQRVMT